jgi:hypothetical protein
MCAALVGMLLLSFCWMCRLSGHVHAGCSGDRSAHISALELRGAQLVIAHSTSMGAARVGRPWLASRAYEPDRQQQGYRTF